MQDIEVIAETDDGEEVTFSATIRIDTPVETSDYRNGGILQTVLRDMLND